MAETSRPLEAEKEDEEGEEAAEAPLRAVPKKPVVPEELMAGNRGARRVSPTSREQASGDPPARRRADTEASPSPRPQPPASPSRRPEASAPPSSSGINLFANDGSFLEMFKKKMEKSTEEPRPGGEAAPETEKRKPIGFVGKRRGGAKLALKTGIVAKKPKNDGDEVLSSKGGAWAQYMAEVKKYKAHQCSDDDKTRPLVK